MEPPPYRPLNPLLRGAYAVKKFLVSEEAPEIILPTLLLPLAFSPLFFLMPLVYFPLVMGIFMMAGFLGSLFGTFMVARPARRIPLTPLDVLGKEEGKEEDQEDPWR